MQGDKSAGGDPLLLGRSEGHGEPGTGPAPPVPGATEDVHRDWGADDAGAAAGGHRHGPADDPRRRFVPGRPVGPGCRGCGALNRFRRAPQDCTRPWQSCSGAWRRRVRPQRVCWASRRHGHAVPSPCTPPRRRRPPIPRAHGQRSRRGPSQAGRQRKKLAGRCVRAHSVLRARPHATRPTRAPRRPARGRRPPTSRPRPAPAGAQWARRTR